MHEVPGDGHRHPLAFGLGASTIDHRQVGIDHDLAGVTVHQDEDARAGELRGLPLSIEDQLGAGATLVADPPLTGGVSSLWIAGSELSPTVE